MATEATPAMGQKSWELSLYELHRTAQELITDDTEIAVSPRSLHSELMCPICLDMLKNTMTTKECLHRFCHDCIITALRSGNKECPTCRKKLISKRSLRPDPNFDMLISKIHPSRDEYEAHQERILANLQKQQCLGMTLEESLKMQALSRAQKMRKIPSMDSSSFDRSEDSPPSHSEDSSLCPPVKKKIKKRSNGHTGDKDAGNGNDDIDTERSSATSAPNTESSATVSSLPQTEVELVFMPLPHDGLKRTDPSATRFIKTTTNATVEHLVKYLSIRHKLDGNEVAAEDASEPPESLFTLYLASGPGQFQPLAPSATLAEVKSKHFKNEPISLFYAYKIQSAVCPLDHPPPPLMLAGLASNLTSTPIHPNHGSHK